MVSSLFGRMKPEEELMLCALLEQRDDSESAVFSSDSDIFRYDTKKGQIFLNKAKASRKYGISHAKQLDIIRELAKRGLFEADWIVKDESSGKFKLKNNAKWAQQLFDEEVIFSNCNGKGLGDVCFIKLSYEEAGIIYNKYIHKHKAQIDFNSVDNRFIVTCDDGKRYYIVGPNDGSRQFNIISYATRKENIGRLITKDELKKVCDIGEDEYIASQVFRNNDTVKIVLSPFIGLKKFTIQVKHLAILTTEQLEIIKNAST